MISAATSRKYAVIAALSLTVIVCTSCLIFYHQTVINGTPRYLASRRRNHSQTVVCMIHTTPDSWSTRGKAVRHTWGPRCTFPIYFYSNKAAGPDHEIRKAKEAVGLDVEHGRGHLTAKTRAGLAYSYKEYGEEADWFMKVDDDTYLVWENLVILLNELQPQMQRNSTATSNNSRKPLYVGRQFSTHLPHGYNSGGAGYLMNYPAARLYLEGVDKHPKECLKDGGIEDLDTGRCLASFGIYPAETRDEKRKLRFHDDSPMKVFDGSLNYFYINLAGAEYGSRKQKHAEQMLSERAVTFHYIKPEQILMFDYLLYHLKIGDTPSRRGSGGR